MKLESKRKEGLSHKKIDPELQGQNKDNRIQAWKC